MLGFDSYANVIQAAVAGQGLALGYGGIIDLLLADGTLVRPLKAALSRGQAVYLVVPRTATPSPNVKAFCDWVLAEAGARG
jgi:DNA-binding transcriptional LysR family regulator